jgi:hypothetical protein
VFSVSMIDIEKVLTSQKKTDWELYFLIIIMSFKCVWSYDDWEVCP